MPRNGVPSAVAISIPSRIPATPANPRAQSAKAPWPAPAEPRIFIKPSTALNATRQPIRLPPDSKGVQHEAELAVVIGQRLYRADEKAARAAIFGATCFNDVTARDIQKREAQNTRAKSYDTFACLYATAPLRRAATHF